MAPDRETVEGYVIDIACVRKNAREELLEKAETHTRECALHGHCIESGYAVVGGDDRLTLLDGAATRDVVDLVERSERDQGHRVQVTRENDDGSFRTTGIEEV